MPLTGVFTNSRNFDENGMRAGYRAVTHADFDEEGNLIFGKAYNDQNLGSPTVQVRIHRYSWPDDAGMGSENRSTQNPISIGSHPLLRAVWE